MTQTTNLKLNMFETAVDKFSNDALNENWQKIDDSLALTGSAEGSSIQITDAANNCSLYSLHIEGKSVQNGTPTPVAPIEIESIGDSGSLTITIDNGEDLSASATITSALPLRSLGDICDEFVFNGDGSAKIIKRIGLMTFDGTSEGTWVKSTRTMPANRHGYYLAEEISKTSDPVPMSNRYIVDGVNSPDVSDGVKDACTLTDIYSVYFAPWINSSISTLGEFIRNLAANPMTWMYVLNEPQTIYLTAKETQAMFALKTYENLTNITNSENVEMSVKYWKNEDAGAFFSEMSSNYSSRLTALENAILGG